MNNKHNINNPVVITIRSDMFAEVVSERQWIIMQSRFVNGESYESIGWQLSLGCAVTKATIKNGLEKINRKLNKKIESIKVDLRKSISIKGNRMKVKECLEMFLEISEAEFLVLIAAMGICGDGEFYRDKNFIVRKE